MTAQPGDRVRIKELPHFPPASGKEGLVIARKTGRCPLRVRVENNPYFREIVLADSEVEVLESSNFDADEFIRRWGAKIQKTMEDGTHGDHTGLGIMYHIMAELKEVGFDV